MKYTITTHSKKLLADTLTPVNIYLKLRDVFAGSILLESSDYHGHENSLSYICCEPIASFEVKDNVTEIHLPDGQVRQTTLTKTGQVNELLENFRNAFAVNPSEDKFANAGLFGYMAYDAVGFFEDV